VLSALRPGVTRVREELAALAGAEVAEITSDRAEGWTGRSVVVGTEAALHRVSRAGAVAFLEFDQELTAPRYRAAEQALALLVRAGRIVGGRAGRVLVQTRLPRHEVLRAAVGADPAVWSDVEQGRRRDLGLPPYAALAIVDGERAGELVGALPPDRSVQVAPIGERRHLLRATDHGALCDALASARAAVGAGPGLRIEVDPNRV
jgi:primosomal protein N' (replication factor Y)